MKVSFAVTVHNEGKYIDALLSQLYPFVEKQGMDELVILDDFSTEPATIEVLSRYKTKLQVIYRQRALNQDFASQKNYLNSLCTGDYIFQLDADELVATELLENLHDVLEMNSLVDLFLVPRINTVEGLTQAHIQAWGWTVTEKGWIQWPDYQTRLYRNVPDRIKWVGKVHERIVGFDKHAHLPAAPEYCILHAKTIERQEAQNIFYSRIHS